MTSGAQHQARRAILFVAYVTSVVAVATRHEMWRDEVRAWSRALDGDSFVSMVLALRHEGHPFLWYALLRLGHSLTSSPLVLPVMSASVAAAAVFVFIQFAPFTWAWKAMFVFGALPLFEYSVMCRNYGLGMLMLFVVATLYRWRFEHPIRHGALLFVLANTSAHAAILAGGFIAAWALETWGRRRTGGGSPQKARIALGMGLALVGIAFCAYLAFPEPEATATRLRRVTMGGVAHAAVTTVWQLVPPFDDGILGEIPTGVLGIPGQMVGRAVAAVVACVIGVVALRLWRHRDLAFGFGSAAFALLCFFRIVYPGSLRHVGLLFVMILCLEWIARQRETGAAETGATGRVLVGATLTAVLALHLVAGVVFAARDYAGPVSSSKAFAAFVRSRPEYREAVIVGEPDTLMESLPYYLGNRLFSAREERFVRWVTYSAAARELSLGGLLDAAEAVGRARHAPALLVIGHLPVFRDPAGRIHFGYDLYFSWTAEERRRLAVETQPVATFEAAAGDENYAVFLVRR